MGRKRIYQTATERQRAHRARSSNPDAALARWRSRPFIAIDGEGEDDTNGIHHYTMLTINNHSIEAASLSTHQCLDFLLLMKQYYPDGIFVGFSLNYDWNMILRDIPPENLKELNEKNYTLYYPYGISWIVGKMFRLSLYQRGKKKPVQSMTVYDTFGFFQTSFIVTLHKWDIGTQQERNIIYEMKKRRGIFNQTNNSDILDYNKLECKLLVDLMNKLREGLDTAQLYLRSWHGAGAVGGTLLRKHDIHLAIENPTEAAIQHAIMCAYFGGRFQTQQLGEHYDCHTHDIRSAYPSAFCNLPYLTGGQWAVEDGKNYDSITEPDKMYSLWYVSWKVNTKTPVCPFPHRYKRRISYPSSGEGWYYYPEIRAAIAHFGRSIKIERGIVFTPAVQTKPFAFLLETYEQRKTFVKQHNSAEKVLKLGINSVYGKTAQGSVRNGQTPTFQCYFYAGYCTSVTRAKIFELAMRKPGSIIAFATDGVFASERLTTDDEEINTLGSWEHDQLDYLLWAQSGVYFGIHKQVGGQRLSSRVVRKTRGLGRSEINFAELRRKLRVHTSLEDVQQTVTLRRFFGLQYCRHINAMDKWRKWNTIEKTLTLMPNTNYITGRYKNGIIPLYTISYAGIPSEPYVTKGGSRETDNADLLELYQELDQPLMEE